MQISDFKGGFDSNLSYLVVSEKEALIIDPLPFQNIITLMKEEALSLKYIINTHSHFDHLQGNNLFLEKTNAKLIPLNNNTPIKLNTIKIKFIPTPGHTPDSRCILINNKHLFTGDTLFVNNIGKTSSKKDFQRLLNSLKELSLLPDNTIIHPGHDYGPTKTSTLKKEKQLNPYLQSLI